MVIYKKDIIIVSSVAIVFLEANIQSIINSMQGTRRFILVIMSVLSCMIMSRLVEPLYTK
jgi:hypothetical protein